MSIQATDSNPCLSAMALAMTAGATALTAGLFTSVGPVGGAVFGAGYYLSSRVISYICDKVNCNSDSLIGKIGVTVLSVIGSVGAAAVITTAVGFPMTMASAALLMTASVATTCALVGSALCCFGICGGAALAASQTYNDATYGREPS